MQPSKQDKSELYTLYILLIKFIINAFLISGELFLLLNYASQRSSFLPEVKKTMTPQERFGGEISWHMLKGYSAPNNASPFAKLFPFLSFLQNGFLVITKTFMQLDWSWLSKIICLANEILPNEIFLATFKGTLQITCRHLSFLIYLDFRSS